MGLQDAMRFYLNGDDALWNAVWPVLESVSWDDVMESVRHDISLADHVAHPDCVGELPGDLLSYARKFPSGLEVLYVVAPEIAYIMNSLKCVLSQRGNSEQIVRSLLEGFVSEATADWARVGLSLEESNGVNAFRELSRKQFPLLALRSNRKAAGLVADVSTLCAIVGENFPDRQLSKIVSSVGDRHAGGRSTTRVEFANGDVQYFKPRSSLPERVFYSCFTELLSAMGQDWSPPQIVDGEGCHMVEDVVFSRPKSHGEWAQYYRNVGHLTALCYVLGIRDLHFDNVISAGVTPVPVDLECILQPRLPSSASGFVGTRDAAWRLREELSDSVLSPLILPQYFTAGDQTMWVGACFAEEEYSSLVKVLKLDPSADGRPSFTYEYERSRRALKSATANAAEFSTHEIMKTVSAGIYNGLEYLAGNGMDMLDRAIGRYGVPTVRILNATSTTYGQMLTMLTRPELASDVCSSCAACARVVRFSQVRDARFLTAEVISLLSGDIPQLWCGADGHIDWSSSLWHMGPREAVRERVSGLTPENIQFQSDLGALSFVPVLGDAYEPTGFSMTRPGRATDGALLEFLSIEQDRLLGSVRVEDSGCPNWLDLGVGTSSTDRFWSPSPMDISIYGGVLGPASTLVAANIVFGDKFLPGRELGERIFSALAEYLDDPSVRDAVGNSLPLGAAGGLGGLAKVFRWHADVTGSVASRRAADIVIGLCCNRDFGSDGDFISGACGIIRPLEVAGVSPSVLGDLRDIVQGNESILDLTGYAHGVAGVLGQVASCETVFPEEFLNRLVNVLVASELDGGGWSTGCGLPERAFAWCHGTPGVVLGLAQAAASGMPGLGEYIERGVKHATEECFGRSFTLCHGDVGNALCLRRVDDLVDVGLDGNGMLGEAIHAGIRVVNSKYPPRGAYSSSVMVGRQGLAWGILELSSPGCMPDLLW